MKSSDICAALRERFQQPEWCLFFEVSNGTGANAKRHADGLAMNMYPSRGLALLGFEIKVSRSDLKRELETPDKAEAVAQYCDEWWLVVPKGLIKPDDNIPVPWGIMECDNGKLRVTKRAQQLTPKSVTKDFMAAVLRSAGKVDEATVREATNKAHQEAREIEKARADREIEQNAKRFKALLEKVQEFEKVTGRAFGQYTDVEDLADKLKLVCDTEKFLGRRSDLNYVRRTMHSFLEATEHLKIAE